MDRFCEIWMEIWWIFQVGDPQNHQDRVTSWKNQQWLWNEKRYTWRHKCGNILELMKQMQHHFDCGNIRNDSKLQCHFDCEMFFWTAEQSCNITAKVREHFGTDSKLHFNRGKIRTGSKLQYHFDCGMFLLNCWKTLQHHGISVDQFWNWWKKCNITLTVGTSERIQNCNINLTVGCFFDLLKNVATSRHKCGTILELMKSKLQHHFNCGNIRPDSKLQYQFDCGMFFWTDEKSCNITA